jgi:hypothetical protein
MSTLPPPVTDRDLGLGLRLLLDVDGGDVRATAVLVL